MSRVVFTTPFLAHYRVRFHELVREYLGRHGIAYKLVYGQPSRDEAQKDDAADIAWATRVRNRYGPGTADRIAWQPLFGEFEHGDLVVLTEGNRLLANYPIQLRRKSLGIGLALWGHGRNLQSTNPDGVTERWKRHWALQSDWWFTYTQDTRRYLEAIGMPADRITVVNNSIDTRAMQDLSSSVTDSELSAMRQRLGTDSANIGLYVGSLYKEKRISFLIECAQIIRATIPDFVLVIIGNGPDRLLVEEAQRRCPWIRYLGTQFGREKVQLMMIAKAFLMPGLMGLSVLDCAAVGLPVVTTAYPLHSPEIEYLKLANSGLVIPEWTDKSAFASGVIQVILDETVRTKLRSGAREVAQRYSIESMADRFATGATLALNNIPTTMPH
jgi:glycosyltransferase involved in cell wall biosynthesis